MTEPDRSVSRSKRVKANIIALMARKGLGAALSYLLVPLLLDYLDPLRYGVWITMVSVVGWLYLFDIGLGNGMQNALASAIAKKDLHMGKVVVSTTYYVMSLIAVGLLILTSALFAVIDWGGMFNVTGMIAEDVAYGLTITVAFYLVQLVVRLVGVVLTADERPAIAGYFSTAGTVLTLILVVIVKQYVPGSIALLALIMGVANLIPPVVASAILYRSHYKDIRPSWRTVDIRQAPQLFTLGVKFLVIQISAMVIYTTDSMIIVQMFSPEDVTPYALAAKYVGISTIVFGIILKPMWASFTQAHVMGEYVWINRVIKKLFALWTLVAGVTALLVIASPWVYEMWIGDAVKIPLALTIAMGVHVVVFNYGQIFSKYLNGVGKLQVQYWLSVITALLNIPLSIVLAGPCGLGTVGVILGTILTNIPVVIASSYQYYLLSNDRAIGLWNR